MTYLQSSSEQQPLIAGTDQGKTFGQIVTEWRRRHGISQAQMARDAGVARETLAQLERGGKKRPHARTGNLVRAYMKKISDERKTSSLNPDHDAAPGGVVTSFHPHFAVVRGLCEYGQVVLVDGLDVAIYQISRVR